MYRTLLHQVDLYERTIVMILGGLLVVVGVGYLYFVSVSVFAVVERNHIGREIENAKGRLADKEHTYVDIAQSITLSLAKDRGFHSVNDPTYLSSETPRTTVSLRGD